MTDPFPDPPTHERCTLWWGQEVTPGDTYITYNGVEWQVADCWREKVLGSLGRWVVELVRQKA